MIGRFLAFAKQLLTFVETSEKNKEEIRELRREFAELLATIERMKHEFQRSQDNERHEREKFFLQVENAMLRLERRLPQGKTGKEAK